MKKPTAVELFRRIAEFAARYRRSLLLAGLTLVSFLLLYRTVPLPTQLLLAAAGVCAALGCSRRSGFPYLLALGIFTCFERHFIIHIRRQFLSGRQSGADHTAHHRLG